MSWDWLPSWQTFAGTFLTWAVPWSIYNINKKLHRMGDPGWKQVNSSNSDKEQ